VSNPITTSEQASKLLVAMRSSRACDDYERQSIMRGNGGFQVGGSGAEICAIAGLHLTQNDEKSLHWRDRALRLLCGISLEQTAAGFFHTGGFEGTDRNLTCHESSLANRIFPVATPVPSHCLPACGLAWNHQLNGDRKRICICSVGDGSTRQGEFLESLAFAIERKLAILFVVIDNEYAISTPTEGLKASDLGLVPQEILTHCDGWRIQSTLDSYSSAFAAVRNGGPHVLSVRTPRLISHTSNDDQRQYRSEQALNESVEHDPLPAFEAWLQKVGLLDGDQIQEITERCVADVCSAYEQAASHQADKPTATVRSQAPSLGANRSSITSSVRMRDAINSSLKSILADDSSAVLFGEDIEDPLGGVFRLTSGLSTEFPSQVFNSPLAEATILGVSAGLAAAGRTAIAEIQFIDFLSPGYNQLVTNICTLRWRTCGVWKCPLIMYAPVDGYCPGEGMWHSQVNASLFARQTGLRIVMPSNPVDVHVAFDEAVQSDDPTLILLPKAQFWVRHDEHKIGTLVETPCEADGARVCQSGTDVTIISWGNGIVIGSEAAATASVSCEVVDLRYLNPIDIETVLSSVRKTKRAVIVDPEHDGASLGNFIAVQIYEAIPDCRVGVLHRRSQHLGCTAESEDHSLVSSADVLAEVTSLVSETK